MSARKPGILPMRSHVDAFLYKQSVFAFIGFMGLAVWAFWTSYYGISHKGIAWPMRLHGMAMTAWCLMLILQALLIRLKKNKLHKVTGKLSYLIVPFILVTGVQLAHITVKGMEAGSSLYYYFIALMFNSLVAFAIIYGLAMWHRKRPLTHARYMVCTVFPLFTPITDRLIYKHFQELIEWVPVVEGMPLVQMLGFAFADLILIILAVWDWKAHKRLDVFPGVLLLLGLYQVSVLTFYKLPFWRQIGDWVMNLPFS